MNSETALSLAAILILGCACSQKEASETPMPEKKPVELEAHGDKRIDDYFWLKERDDPEVIAYLEAENAHTESKMQPMAGLRKQLFDEMKARIKEDEESAPYKHGDYYYYVRYRKGGEYPIYVRRRGSLDAPEEILLDVNAIADDETYFAVRNFNVSPDHRLAAYGVDTRGRRFYTIYFLDLTSGELLDDKIPDVTNNFEWANDSRTLFYAKQDRDTLRWDRVYRHSLGNDEDILIYQETDETNWLFLSKSLSGDYVYLTSSQTLSTEVRYVSADRPDEPARLFLPREDKDAAELLEAALRHPKQRRRNEFQANGNAAGRHREEQLDGGRCASRGRVDRELRSAPRLCRFGSRRARFEPDRTGVADYG